MKKTIIGIVSVLLVAGILTFVFSREKSKTDFSDKEVVKIEKLNPDKGILCIQKVAVGEDGNSLENKIYIWGKKTRFDGSLGQEEQGQKDFHMITDGEYQYIWGKGMMAGAFGANDGKVHGMKMKVMDKEEDMGPDFDIDELEKNNFQAPGVICKTWEPDEDIFKLPENVEFKDMSVLMGGMGSMMGGQTGSPDCDSMCGFIPNVKDKEECLKSCEEENDK